MAFDTNEFHSVVRETMKDYGIDATYSAQSDQGTYNPDTGEFTAAAEDIQVKAIMLDLTLQSNGDAVKQGTLIRAGDKCVYLQPTDSLTSALYPDGVLKTDVADDFITISGTRYKIVTAKVYGYQAAGKLPYLFELYVRR